MIQLSFNDFFLFLFSLSSCSVNENFKSNEKQNLANEIRYNSANKIKNKYGLRPCGTGAEMMRQIKMLSLSFIYTNPITINSVRKILVSIIDDFLEEINSDSRIHPHLENYPFEPKNVQIVIFIHNPDYSHFGPKELCVLSATNGVLEYRIDGPNGKLFETVYKETYEEDLQKLESSMQESAFGACIPIVIEELIFDVVGFSPSFPSRASSSVLAHAASAEQKRWGAS